LQENTISYSIRNDSLERFALSCLKTPVLTMWIYREGRLNP
jgi:hypothetical protein